MSIANSIFFPIIHQRTRVDQQLKIISIAEKHHRRGRCIKSVDFLSPLIAPCSVAQELEDVNKMPIYYPFRTFSTELVPMLLQK